MRATYSVQRYRPHIEGLFARIERWSNTKNPADVHWRSISKDNILTVYGKDRLFVELQEHSIPELTQINKKLVEMADRYDLRFLATNDVHYTRPEDADPHDVLLCIQTSTTVQTENRMRFSDKGYYLKAHSEMAQLFGDIPGALDNSLLIAEMCDIDLANDAYHLPHFSVPEGHTPASYLRELCTAGLTWRYGENRVNN